MTFEIKNTAIVLTAEEVATLAASVGATVVVGETHTAFTAPLSNELVTVLNTVQGH